MKTKTIITLILLSSGILFSQNCTLTIPPLPAHIKITSSQTLNGAGTIYWICSGLTVNIASSSGSAYYLESNVTLNFTGTSGDAVWAKAGCVINNASPDDIAVSCNTTNVVRNNTGSGSITDIFCPTVSYIYTLVGGGPCSGVTNINERTIGKLKISPNPVNQGENILIDDDFNETKEIRIRDIAGKLIETTKCNSNTVSTGKLIPGFYILEIEKEGKIGKGRILVQ